MKAIIINQHGDPSVLQPSEIEKPTIAPDEVLVKQSYAGINFIDIYFRQGVYPVGAFPHVLGKEGIGVIVELGQNVKAFQIGQRIGYAFASGSYAEYAAVNQNQIVPIPDTVEDQIALASMLQGMTAHYLAKSTYQIQKKDTVLIHAGAGGVGLILIQMAKMLGAEVYTTVSNEAKKKLASEAGADHVIIYENNQFLHQLLEHSKGEKMHVVYDSVGKTTFDESIQAIKPLGMMVLFGQSSGAVPAFDLNRLNPAGSLYITRPSLAHYIADNTIRGQRANDLFAAIKAGIIRISVGGVYPLHEAKQAHIDLEQRKTTGKLLLKI